PLVGCRRAIAAGPFEERVHRERQRVAGDDGAARRPPHDLVEATHGVLLVTTEVVTLAIDRDAPDLAVGAEPRLRFASHCRALQQFGELTGKPEGLRSRSGAS